MVSSVHLWRNGAPYSPGNSPQVSLAIFKPSITWILCDRWVNNRTVPQYHSATFQPLKHTILGVERLFFVKEHSFHAEDFLFVGKDGHFLNNDTIPISLSDKRYQRRHLIGPV